MRARIDGNRYVADAEWEWSSVCIHVTLMVPDGMLACAGLRNTPSGGG